MPKTNAPLCTFFFFFLFFFVFFFMLSLLPMPMPLPLPLLWLWLWLCCGRGRGGCSCRLNDFSRAIISISIQGLGLMCFREAAVCRGSAPGSLSPNKDCSMLGIPTRATINISLIMRPLTVDTGVPSVVSYCP